MKDVKQNGFVLMFVVSIIPLIGVALLILAGGTRGMLAESAMAMDNANRRNLIASGAAWAKHNIEKVNKQQKGFTKRLDVTWLGLTCATCDITVEEASEDAADIIVKVAWIRGGRKLQETVTISALH